MSLYALYAIVIAGIIIAAIAAIPSLSDRMRRWLIAAVALLVIVPAALAILAGIFN